MRGGEADRGPRGFDFERPDMFIVFAACATTVFDVLDQLVIRDDDHTSIVYIEQQDPSQRSVPRGIFQRAWNFPGYQCTWQPPRS